MTKFRRPIIFLGIALIDVAIYVGFAAARGHVGYPLDDAWIHQTYARNWAATGQLAYVVGQPSAGSTAPLWTLLISIAYRLQIDPYIWTLFLGAICLAWSAWLLSRLAERLRPNRKRVAWIAELACLFEWHLIWAAASGMETMLFIALALTVIDRTLAGERGWTIGLWGGLLMLTRPEGLLLMGLVLVVLLTRSDHGGLQEILSAVLGLGVAIAPGALINYQASGTLLPNTFYAKQQEYAALMSSAVIWLRSIGDMIVAPFVGGQLLLWPGVCYWFLKSRSAIRVKSGWVWLLPLGWIGVHTVVYALRLPVAYQHGRYLMPIIPIVLLYGIVGSSIALDRPAGSAESKRVRWMIARALIVSAAIVLIAFVPIGAGAFATDVSIIDDEMVKVARWLSINTPPDALIAAHDIGAIGYFAQRPLIDLAGLISPEVIPFIRDEDRLAQWIESRRAAYLVTFPNWYPVLSRSSILTAVFRGDALESPEHMVVYRVQASSTAHGLRHESIFGILRSSLPRAAIRMLRAKNLGFDR